MGGAVLHRPGPFHFARLCNEGAHWASGEWLLFLNNDTEVLSPDWLTRMLTANLLTPASHAPAPSQTDAT